MDLRFFTELCELFSKTLTGLYTYCTWCVIHRRESWRFFFFYVLFCSCTACSHSPPLHTHTHIYSHLVLAALSEQLSISDLGDGLNCFEQFLTSRIMVSHCLPHHVHHPIVYKDTVSIHMPHVTEIIQAPENKYNKIFGKIRSDTSSHSCKQY